MHKVLKSFSFYLLVTSFVVSELSFAKEPKDTKVLVFEQWDMRESPTAKRLKSFGYTVQQSDDVDGIVELLEKAESGSYDLMVWVEPFSAAELSRIRQAGYVGPVLVKIAQRSQIGGNPAPEGVFFIDELTQETIESIFDGTFASRSEGNLSSKNNPLGLHGGCYTSFFRLGLD